jgi:hypothetical protein
VPQQHSLGVVRDPAPRNPSHLTLIPSPPTLQVIDNPMHVSDLDIDMEMCDIVQVEITGGILSRSLEDARDFGSAESTLSFPNQCTQLTEQGPYFHDQGQNNQPYLLSDSNGANEAKIAWNHKGKVFILEPAACILELLKPQPKSSSRIFFNPTAVFDEEDEDLLREVNSPHNELDPNKEEAFLDAYALQLPQSRIVPSSPQLATIESALPSFRQNVPKKKTLEALNNDRVARHLRLATMERSQTLSTQAGHASHVSSNLIEPQLAPLTSGVQLPTT